MRKTSSRRNISLHPGQNGRRTIIVQNSKVRMSSYLDTSAISQLAKIMVQYGRSSRSSWTTSVRSSFGRTLMRKAIRESSTKFGREKVPNWECLSGNREKGLFLSVYVDDVKLAGKTHIIYPTWNVLMKDVDLGEPTSFLDHVHFGCTQRVPNQQRYCDELQKYVRIQDFRWGFEKLLISGKSDANISSRSCDMEGHAKKCAERYCELANEIIEQLDKVETPCMDDRQFKKKMSQ